MFRRCVCLLSFVLLFVLSTFAVAAAQSESNKNKARYAGSDACQPCHDEVFTAFTDTAHAALLRNTRSEDNGCEACHGPGQNHIDQGGDRTRIRTFTNMSKEEVREQCRRCHKVSGDKPHVTKGVGCMSCHSIHHSQQKKSLLVEPANRLCQKCHSD